MLLALTLKGGAAGTNAVALSKIGAAEATNYYNQEMIVTGRVAQVSIRPRITFLNLDEPYPESPFTIVIFPGTFVPDVKALDGKAIEIRGKIKNYRGKPEIVLDNTNQLTVPGGWIPATNAPPDSMPANPSPSKPPANVPPDSDATNLPEIM